MTDEIPTMRPPGTGEMAALIRSFDWEATPLGPNDHWPSPLRSAAAMIRAASSPVAVFWGPDLILLYNDAWSELMGGRHADFLGKSAHSAFPDAWGQLSPLFEAVLHGDGSRRADDVLVTSRNDGDKWYTFSLEPLPLEDDTIGGVLSVAIETTEGALARRTLRDNSEQQAYLLRLSDAIGPLGRAEDIMAEATRVLGEHLGLTRAAYGEVEADDQHIVFCRNYVKPGAPVISGRFQMTEFGPALVDALKSGRIITVNDVSTSAVFSREERKAYKALGIEALMGVPLVKGGRLAANISMHCDASRTWSTLDISLARETAERTWAAVERARAEAALKESEERLKQFGEASQDILWIRDRETLQWQYLTPAFEAVYGIPREEALTGDNFASWLDLILPEDREAARAAIGQVARGEHVSFEYRIRRPSDGEIRWLKDTDFPILGDDGTIRFIGGIGMDVTKTKLTHERLEQSEERLRNALEVGRLGMWDWNVKTGEVTWSDEHFRMEGYAVGEVVPSYEAWAARIHPDDREATEAALKQAMERREDYVREFRVLHPDGNVRWLYGRGRFFFDDIGHPMRMVGAMIDVTDRKAWEERLQVLVLELQHRTRNLLGVVRSLANSTLRSSSSLSEFRATFQDRLAALARVNSLLSRLNEGDRIHFEELLAAELLALGVSDAYKDRITLEGPHGVRLRSGTVQTFALALHELATNAVKYGAFATPGGSLVIRWGLSRQDGKTQLDLEWKERGVQVPAPDSAFRRTGYGRELIERALPYQLKAKTTYVLEEDGVHCTIMMPISEG